MTPTAQFRRPARRGFTLVELLIAMTMLAVVGGTIVTMLNGQQRFVRAASDIGAMRSQLQTAAVILPADLRAISASGADIRSMSDSSVQVRATIASSIVCAIAGNVVTLAPDSPLQSSTSSGTVDVKLTSIMLPPAAGDSIFLWDQDSTRWGNGAATTPYGITGVATSTCATLNGQPFASSGPALQLTLGATPSATGVAVGTTVRVVRDVRYGLYQSSADNQWYLGYRDYNSTDFTGYENVAGPFRPYASGATSTSGVRFAYFDTTGTEITDYTQVARVARIQTTAQAQTNTPVSLSGSLDSKQHEDWLRVGVSIRNRN